MLLSFRWSGGASEWEDASSYITSSFLALRLWMCFLHLLQIVAAFFAALTNFLEVSEHLTAYLNCHGLEWISMDVESLRSFRDWVMSAKPTWVEGD